MVKCPFSSTVAMPFEQMGKRSKSTIPPGLVPQLLANKPQNKAKNSQTLSEKAIMEG
jgi:hypothetical protein